MVIAHPDDESLFGGAELLKGNYKVICVTNGDNPIRKLEFEAVMKHTNSEYEIWEYLDKYHVPLKETLKEDLFRIVNWQKWDKIVTHNEKGEYGHPHHIQIHKIMKELVGKELWTFDFSKKIDLPDDIWQAKLKLIDFHKSQKHICNEHIPNVRNESIFLENNWQ